MATNTIGKAAHEMERAQARAAKAEADAVNAQYAKDAERIQQDYAQRLLALEEEVAKIRARYKEAARQAQKSSQKDLAKARAELAALGKYADLRDTVVKVAALLKEASTNAEALRAEETAAVEAAKHLASMKNARKPAIHPVQTSISGPTAWRVRPRSQQKVANRLVVVTRMLQRWWNSLA
jgi:hypothetical protein